jgi:hypothetical protein
VALEHVERKLAAIVAADVAGYSRLTGADEEGTMRRLRALIHAEDVWTGACAWKVRRISERDGASAITNSCQRR